MTEAGRRLLNQFRLRANVSGLSAAAILAIEAEARAAAVAPLEKALREIADGQPSDEDRAYYALPQSGFLGWNSWRAARARRALYALSAPSPVREPGGGFSYGVAGPITAEEEAEARILAATPERPADEVAG